MNTLSIERSNLELEEIYWRLSAFRLAFNAILLDIQSINGDDGNFEQSPSQYEIIGLDHMFSETLERLRIYLYREESQDKKFEQG